MSRPITRAKNANQRPGLILLEGTQKRRTSEQKKADDEHAKQEHLKQKAAREHGIQCIGDLMDQLTQREEHAHTHPPQPRPRPRIVHKASSLVEQATHEAADNRMEVMEEGNYMDSEDEVIEGSQIPTHMLHPVSDDDGCQFPDSLMQDSPNTGNQEPGSAAGQKRKQATTNAVIKDNISGVGHIEDWANKITSAKPVHALIAQHSRGRGRGSRQTVSSANSRLKSSHRGSPASTTSNVRVSSAHTNAGGSNTASISYIEYLDEDGSQPPPSTQFNLSHQKQAMMIDVISDSELADEEREIRSDAISPIKALSAPPHSKRAQTLTSQRQGSGAHNKFVNSDLPAGAVEKNIWCRVFVSTVVHLAGIYQNPWSIPDETLQAALQKTWNVVYRNIPHTVDIGGAVYYISKQALSNWRAGFACAVIAVITTFFANDPKFSDKEKREAFAEAMIGKNRFLFRDNKGLDNKAWSGLWRAPFLLQTFAHHYNFIQGHIEVTGMPLGFQGHGARSALALACAALSRILTLTANGQMTFQPGKSAALWTSFIPKGNQFDFNENIWGATTQRYFAPIQEMSDEQFDLVVKEAHAYVKVTSLSASGSFNSTGDDDFDDLFTFR